LQIGQISQSCLQEEKFHAEQLFSVAVCFYSFFFGGGGSGTWGLLNFLGGNFWGTITLRARIGVCAHAGRVLRDSAQ